MVKDFKDGCKRTKKALLRLWNWKVITFKGFKQCNAGFCPKLSYIPMGFYYKKGRYFFFLNIIDVTLISGSNVKFFGNGTVALKGTVTSA